MESEDTDSVKECLLSEEDTLSDVESSETASLLFEDEQHVMYDDKTGELIVTIPEGSIPPSGVPGCLPVLSQEEIWEKETTVLVKDKLEDLQKIFAQCEPISSDSDITPPRSVSMTRPFIPVEPIDSASDWEADENNNSRVSNVPGKSLEGEYEDISSAEEVQYEDVSDEELPGEENRQTRGILLAQSEDVAIWGAN